MRLKLEELQKVVKRAIDDERAVETLRTEVSRVLGPAVLTEGHVEQLAESANDWIDVLERTGRSSQLTFKPAIMVPLLGHNSAEVRKLAARVVPSKFLSRMIDDRSDVVRSTVAKRLPIVSIREMLKRFPNDDEVRVIYRQRRLMEDGIKQPKVIDEPFDMHGVDRLGDSVKQDEGTELSDQWYKDKAHKFMQDYGGNIEDSWEEVTANRYVSSMKATSGVEIDKAKLLKAIKDMIAEREDRVLQRNPLKETLSWLKSQDERELMQESAMPIIEENSDPVLELIQGELSPSSYIDEANQLFKIKESVVPASIRKYRLSELSSKSMMIPVVGRLPSGQNFRALDERALDLYCKHWNDRQNLHDDPLKLEWSNHPEQVDKISFNVVLK